jgi:hypothetical protein
MCAHNSSGEKETQTETRCARVCQNSQVTCIGLDDVQFPNWTPQDISRSYDLVQYYTYIGPRSAKQTVTVEQWSDHQIE